MKSDAPGSAIKRGGGGTVSDGSNGTGGRGKSVKGSSSDDVDRKGGNGEQGGESEKGSDDFSHDGLTALLRSISQAAMGAENPVDDSTEAGSADREKDKPAVSSSTTVGGKRKNMNISAAPTAAAASAAKPSPLDSFLRIGKDGVVDDAKDTPRKQGGEAGGSASPSAKRAVAVMTPPGDGALNVEHIAGVEGGTKKKPVNLDLPVRSNSEELSGGVTQSIDELVKGQDGGTKKPSSPSVCPTPKREVLAEQGERGAPRLDKTTPGLGEGDTKKKRVSLSSRFSQENPPGAEHGMDTEKPMNVVVYSNVEKVGGGWWGGGTKKPVSSVAYSTAGKVVAVTRGKGGATDGAGTRGKGRATDGAGTKPKVVVVVGGTESCTSSNGGVTPFAGSFKKKIIAGVERGEKVTRGKKKSVALSSGLKVAEEQTGVQRLGSTLKPRSVGVLSLKVADRGGRTGGLGMASSANKTTGGTGVGALSLKKVTAAVGERCDGAAGGKAKKPVASAVNLLKQKPKRSALPVADVFTRVENPPPGAEKEPSTTGQVRTYPFPL